MSTARVRAAAPEDYDAFAALVPQLGSGDPPPPRTRWDAEVCAQTLLAERDGVIEGYVFGQSLRGVGYVRHLVTEESARGRGVGRALMESIAERFREAGCARWCLNVKPDNAPALGLYTSLGLREAHRGVSLRVAWTELARLPPPPAGLVARPALEADDLALESAWDLTPGQLAYSRAHRWVVLCLDDAAGVACFNPSFPGAFPFRARDLGCASALLRAMRAHALPDFYFVRVNVEADEALRAALEALGAEVMLEVMHLRGAIPERGVTGTTS
ncbi:MAG: GNAT family N-acetyltransferase [Polyangiales bacterium]